MWIPLGFSVIGASHEKKGMPNQDSVGYSAESPPFVAVADGHGGKKYIRSDTGACFATKAIGIIVAENRPLLAGDKDIFEAVHHIKIRFLSKWQELVDRELQDNPFAPRELTFLDENCTEAEKKSVIDNPRLAFGCTFLCAIGYEDMVLLLQHGDGDALGLYESDDVRELIPQDQRNFGGQTLSLGSLGNAGEISHCILSDLPSLITLTTDGVKNSYNDTVKEEIEQFYKIPAVIKNNLENNIEDMIKSALERITANGSGDDVTLGILYRSSP